MDDAFVLSGTNEKAAVTDNVDSLDADNTRNNEVVNDWSRTSDTCHANPYDHRTMHVLFLEEPNASGGVLLIFCSSNCFMVLVVVGLCSTYYCCSSF